MRTLLKIFMMLVVGVACLITGNESLLPLKVGAENAPADKPAAEVPPESPNKSSGSPQEPITPARAAREEKALQDARRQQLAEKEAALAAKEQELKKLSAKLDSQIKALEESRKRMDDTMKAQAAQQKKALDEKTQKMIKLFKTMKSEQAGKLLDTMQEDIALSLLGKMDTKSVAKLVPFINQPRILKWITDNLTNK